MAIFYTIGHHIVTSRSQLYSRRRTAICQTKGLIGIRPVSRVLTFSRIDEFISIPNPHRNLRNTCPKRIQQRIQWRGVAAGHEQLVKFIRRRISSYDGHCQKCPAKLPASLRTSDRAKQKHAKNKVFGEMRRFPDEYMQKLQGCQLRVRQKPAQQWTDNAAGVVRFEGAGRGGEN